LSHGLYSSRSRGKWEEQEHLVNLAPNGWKEKKKLEAASAESEVEVKESAAGTKEQRSTWARLIKMHLLINTIGIRRSRKGIWR